MAVINGEAKVKMINAVQTESNQEIFIDSEQQPITPLGFSETTDYLKIPSGSRNISFVGLSGVNTGTTLNFTPSLAYTTFLVADRTANRSIVSYEDNVVNTDAGKVKIRLINLSPNFTTGINVSVESGTLFGNALMFKEASNYFSIDSGLNLKFNVVGSGSIKTINATELEAGKVYTIWFSGTAASTVEAHLVLNN